MLYAPPFGFWRRAAGDKPPPFNQILITAGMLYFRRHDDNKGMLSACRFAKLTLNGNMRQIIYQKPVDESVTAKEWREAYFRVIRRVLLRLDQVTCCAAAFMGSWLSIPLTWLEIAIGNYFEWKRCSKAYERLARLWIANLEKKGLVACKWKGNADLEEVKRLIARYGDSQKRIVSWSAVSSQGTTWLAMLVISSTQSFRKSKAYFRLCRQPEGALEVTGIGVKRMLAPYEDKVGFQLDSDTVRTIEDILSGLQRKYGGSLEPKEMLGITEQQRKAYREACLEEVYKISSDLQDAMMVSCMHNLLWFAIQMVLLIVVGALVVWLVRSCGK